MSYITTTVANSKPNWLDSEVGLVSKTREIPESLGVQDGNKKIVPSGTAFPADSSSATGIVLDDVDVTNGPVAGPILVAGRVLGDRLNIQSAAKTALGKLGIVFVDAPDASRGFTVTYDKDDGTGTVPVDGNSYFEGSVAKVSTTLPLTKAGNTQIGWATTKGASSAVTEVAVSSDVTLYPVWQAD